MSIQRPNEALLQQFASQVGSVNAEELRLIEEFLPAEGTKEFLIGFLTGLGVGYQSSDAARAYFGKAMAVLAERILKTESDLKDYV